MDFGIFFQLPAWPDQSTADRYAATLDEIVLAEELGFSTAWMAELHFEARYGTLPSPMLMATAAAMRTSRIHVGTAVTLLPLHDPVRAAEEAAMLDILSNGRLELGIGRGGFKDHYEGYGISIEERDGRFAEAYEVLKLAWADKPLTFQGEFYQYDEVNVTPKPLQGTNIPLWMAANSDESIARAAEYRLPVFLASMTAAPEQLTSRSETYRRMRAEAADDDGAAKIGMLLPIHVALSGEQARAEVEHSYMSYFEVVGAVASSGGRVSSDPSTIPPLARVFQDISFGRALDEMVAVGSPDEVIEKIRYYERLYSFTQILCWFTFGGRTPQAQVEASMRLFAEAVRPALQAPA